MSELDIDAIELISHVLYSGCPKGRDPLMWMMKKEFARQRKGRLGRIIEGVATFIVLPLGLVLLFIARYLKFLELILEFFVRAYTIQKGQMLNRPVIRRVWKRLLMQDFIYVWKEIRTIKRGFLAQRR